MTDNHEQRNSHLGIGSPVERPLDEIAMERLHAHATTPPGSGPHLAQAVQEIQEEARKVLDHIAAPCVTGWIAEPSGGFMISKTGENLSRVHHVVRYYPDPSIYTPAVLERGAPILPEEAGPGDFSIHAAGICVNPAQYVWDHREDYPWLRPHAAPAPEPRKIPDGCELVDGDGTCEGCVLLETQGDACPKGTAPCTPSTIVKRKAAPEPTGEGKPGPVLTRLHPNGPRLDLRSAPAPGWPILSGKTHELRPYGWWEGDEWIHGFGLFPIGASGGGVPLQRYRIATPAPAPGSDAENPPEGYLPCPFCGSAPESQPWHGGGPHKTMTACENEDCHARPSVTGESPEEARIQWNTRATVAPPQESAAPAAQERQEEDKGNVALQGGHALPIARIRDDGTESARTATAAVRTLERLGYTWRGGEQWAPPLGKPPAYLMEGRESDRERSDLRVATHDAMADARESLRNASDAVRFAQAATQKIAAQRDEALERVRGLEEAIRKVTRAALPYQNESGIIRVPLHPYGGLVAALSASTTERAENAEK